MNSKNIFDDIWQSYQAMLDSLKITYNTIHKNEYHLLKSTNFLNLSVHQNKELIKTSRSNAEDFVILSLWTVFERQLLEHLQSIIKNIPENTSTIFMKKIQNKIENEIEYWKINDILDLFKEIVNPDLIGRAKQIKQYRDWIAHRNPKKSLTITVSPKNAYQILLEIIEGIEKNPEFIKIEGIKNYQDFIKVEKYLPFNRDEIHER